MLVFSRLLDKMKHQSNPICPSAVVCFIKIHGLPYHCVKQKSYVKPDSSIRANKIQSIGVLIYISFFSTKLIAKRYASFSFLLFLPSQKCFTLTITTPPHWLWSKTFLLTHSVYLLCPGHRFPLSTPCKNHCAWLMLYSRCQVFSCSRYLLLIFHGCISLRKLELRSEIFSYSQSG